MGDTIFTEGHSYYKLCETCYTSTFINHFKIQICNAVAGKHNLRSRDVFFLGGGGGEGGIPLHTQKKKDRLIAGKGKNE